MIPLLMELGGNDPAIVLPDADLDLAADCIVTGAFRYNGQRCTAVKRVYAASSIADKLVGRIVERTVEQFGSVGDPRKHPLGPVINDKQASYLQTVIADAKRRGGKILTGGSRDGRYVQATVIDRVSHGARLVSEEQFGPVLPIIRVKDAAEALKLANDTNYGLQASVFSKNKKRSEALAAQLQAGGVHINGPDQRGPDNFLFTGHKDSGLGAQGIRYALEAMGQPKGIVHNKAR
jgi:glyceraldehyde-3-phosphate dehydrogenase (NADP+)